MGLFSRKRDPERELAAAIGKRGSGSTRYKIVDGQLVEVVDPRRPAAGS
jgi:hypothetical protein